MIKFGPSGNSDSFFKEGYTSSLQAPAWLKKIGLDAYEYSFGRGYSSVSEKTIIELGNECKKNSIDLSFHAPYYINLANPDEELAEKSLQYIIKGLELLKLAGGKKLVVHIGTQLKQERTEAIALIKNRLEKLLQIVYNKKLDDMFICLETMGKYSQIGTYQEIFEFCKLDKVLIPTLDFGHINCILQGGLKTEKDYETIIKLMIEELGEYKAKNVHIHFSKIEYTVKGEVKHLTLDDKTFGPEFEPLAKILIKYNLSPTVISESKFVMAEDAKQLKNIYINFKEEK